MNDHMNNEPSRKRLRQTSILDSFNKLRDKDKKKSGIIFDICDSDTIEMNMCENAIGDDLLQERRELLYQAAERRRMQGQSDDLAKELNHQTKLTVIASSSSTTEEDFCFIKSDIEYIDSPDSSTGKSPMSQSAKHLRTLRGCSPTSEGSLSLFSDSESSLSPKETLSCRSSKENRSSGKGTLISKLNKTPECLLPLPALKPCSDHIILFRLPLRINELPCPYPKTCYDKWDGNHVRMPCSPENLYPVEDSKGGKKLESRWELIQRTLLGNIHSSLDLEEAILTYNARYSNRWDFRGLHTFFTEVLERKETEIFFSKTLPAMVSLALQLPSICTQPIPLLKKQHNCNITLSQQQIACLLANAFFCTFPRRNARQKQSEYSSFPEINFNNLFVGTKGGLSTHKAEKLKCILNYFRRITTTVPFGTVTYKRQCLNIMPQWNKSTTKLPHLHIAAQGTIENDGIGMLQVDFANKFVGGGVLNQGCVQEEIRFIICPEMILSRLFTEVLENNECLIMTGCERYNDYEGYANSFRWAGNHMDQILRDAWGRRYTEVVAIDALRFSSSSDQFQTALVQRELNKAYCGFYSSGVPAKHLSAVATGNWGCGAFRGDPRLKALIQVMAAAEAQRDLVYFTFEDEQLQDDIFEMHKFLQEKKMTVGDVWSLIQKYHFVIGTKAKNPVIKLYSFIYKITQAYESETDQSGDD